MTTMMTMTHHPDARFWDRIAKRYARKPVPDEAAYRVKLDKTNAWLKPEHRVLEVGCGTGTTALHHAPRVAHVRATDISVRMIDIAREKARDAGIENATFDVASIADLDAESETYDVILAHSILHLVEDVPAALATLRRRLTPGGLLIQNTQCIGDSAAWFGWVAPLGRWLRVLPRVNVFREPEFLRWLDEAGFDIEDLWQAHAKASHYIVARCRGGLEG